LTARIGSRQEEQDETCRIVENSGVDDGDVKILCSYLNITKKQAKARSRGED
jgi:hypothetical protein